MRLFTIILTCVGILALWMLFIYRFFGFGAVVFVAVLVILLLLGMLFYQTNLIRRQPTQDKLRDATTAIPENLQAFHRALIDMGFELAGEYQVSYLLRATPQWLYFSPDHKILAFIMHTYQTQAGFATYYGDGFVLSTLYPTGRRTDSTYFKSRVVGESLYAAHEIHQHSMVQHNTHGAIEAFATLRDFLDWEHQGKHRQAIYQTTQTIVFKLTGLLLVAVGLGVAIFRMPPEPSVGYLLGLLFAAILALGYTLRTLKPFIFTETTQSRKKKKR